MECFDHPRVRNQCLKQIVDIYTSLEQGDLSLETHLCLEVDEMPGSELPEFLTRLKKYLKDNHLTKAEFILTDEPGIVVKTPTVPSGDNPQK